MRNLGLCRIGDFPKLAEILSIESRLARLFLFLDRPLFGSKRSGPLPKTDMIKIIFPA